MTLFRKFPQNLFLVLIFANAHDLWAQNPAESWSFLPANPLFEPLLGDPREPHTAAIAYLNQVRYEGSVGAVQELVRYTPASGPQWGWGLLGQGYILLDENGATFPMRDGDWYAGMYLSESDGTFSNRLEFEHESSHLGDSLEGLQTPTFFSRENFDLTSSFRPNDLLRFEGQIGDWENMAPAGDPVFVSLGCEVYTPFTLVGGTSLRGYGTLFFGWKGETGSIWDKEFQLGVQWKADPKDTRSIRLALVYYDGDSQFGQFYKTYDQHLGLGVYFDP